MNTKKLLYATVGLGFLGMIGGLGGMLKGADAEQKILEQNETYQVHHTYDRIDSVLEEAQDSLVYTEPHEGSVSFRSWFVSEDYPDPSMATLKLEEALLLYDTIPNTSETYADGLQALADNLPIGMDVEYLNNGEPVDNATFSPERENIESYRTQAQELSNSYVSQALEEENLGPEAYVGVLAIEGVGLTLVIGGMIGIEIIQRKKKSLKTQIDGSEKSKL